MGTKLTLVRDMKNLVVPAPRTLPQTFLSGILALRWPADENIAWQIVNSRLSGVEVGHRSAPHTYE